MTPKIVFALAAVATLVGCACGTNPNQNQVAAYDSSCAVAPVAMAQDPCAVAAAPAPGPCGPLPEEALPGETWCCVPVPVMAAAPQRVCVQPECSRSVSIPAEYETVNEEVLVCPARMEWQEVVCVEAGTEKCWRLVEIPATYETHTRQRLVREAYVRMEYSPPVYESVASAPAAPVYRWKRFEACETPANAAAVYVVPAAPPPPAAPTESTPPAMQ